MKTIRSIIIAGGLLVCLGTAAGVSAEPGKMRDPGMGWSIPLRSLDLTQEQREQIKEIRAEQKQQQKGKTHKPQFEQLQALIQADQLDETAVRTLLEQQQQEMLEKQVAMIKQQHRIYQVLTAEQKTKLAEMQQQRRESAKGDKPPKDGKPPRGED